MAVVLWSNLPTDILLLIAKILNSDVDTIRLRSVCSPWRSSIRRRYRPSSFPLEVPPLFTARSDALRRGTHHFLHYSTFYRLSPPEFGPYAGDPSDGYLLRVLEVNPNTFSPLSPLLPEFPKSDPALVPKHLNLLDFRVSEICKCFSLSSVNATPNEEIVLSVITKVIVLWNYDVDCDFAVVVLIEQGNLYYWNSRVERWYAVHTRGYKFSDVVLYDGKCYAISRQGVLFSIDSKFDLQVTPLPPLPVDSNKCDFYLMEYKSDLYVVSRFYDEGKVNHNCIPPDEDNTSNEDDSTDEDNTSNEDGGSKEIALEVKIFKKCNSWEYIKCLGDEVFLCCKDVSLGLSTKDFSGSKGNCVYFSPAKLVPCCHRAKKNEYGVHDLDEGRTSVMKMAKGRTLACRPCPEWLMST